ncbi:MAG: uracil phosphoribosyltransferase [Bdellovibrionaceae bacterium]|nr:uracil phosphoribosyltransferase [Pseudobdellovibrionaceae bacterium]
MQHHYGKNVHFFDKPYLLGILARLCQPSIFQPDINRYVEYLYGQLLGEVVQTFFPYEWIEVETRMHQDHPEILLKTQQIAKTAKAVCINLARAGTYPSHICYEKLHFFLKPENIRQDHIFAARAINSDNQVTKTELDGFKIGGGIDNSFVLIPDPMGATGNTILSTINHYKQNVPGKPVRFIAMHLIVTPEYLKRVSEVHPDLEIVAIRLDRGLSSAKALSAEPGRYWNEEKGLNTKDYIVPGGGGFGEVMNNSFV